MRAYPVGIQHRLDAMPRGAIDNLNDWLDGAKPGKPMRTSWNLGLPQNVDRVIHQELIDLVMLGRPALANPHWPVWAAGELGHPSPFSLVQQDWRWWLENFRGHAPSIGWPEVQREEVSRAMAAE
jgi:hypothetical protein